MKYRHAIGVLAVAALMVGSIAELAAVEWEWYGGRAIGAESNGFDALAFEVFGGGPAVRSDTRLAASTPWNADVQGTAVK